MQFSLLAIDALTLYSKLRVLDDGMIWSLLNVIITPKPTVTLWHSGSLPDLLALCMCSTGSDE